MKFRLISILLILSILILAGCAKPPEKRMAELESKIDALDSTEFCVYLRSLCGAAKDTFKVALIEMDNQKESFFISRSYNHTEQLLDIADSIIQSALDSLTYLRGYYGKYMESIRVRATNGYDSATTIFEDFRTDPGNSDRVEKLSRKMIDMTMAFGRAKTALENGDTLRAGNQFEQVIRLSNSVIVRMK